MDAIWLGVKIGIGIIIGIGLVRFAFREIVGFVDSRPFRKVGCTFQHEGGSEAHPNGWMTRDPDSEDWILWDVDRSRVMRLHDEAPPSTPWRATTESYGDFMRMAKGYNDWLNGMWKDQKQES
jgi:hypothetical protein